jgi:dTDP-4-amino-4,6-dideoxygalactose transaminase
LAALYDAAFAESDLIEIPPRREGDRHAWHLYVVRLQLERMSVDRAEVIDRMAGEGIATSVHFIPLHLHPYYRGLGYAPGDFPVAESLYERSMSLPLWPGMTDEQVSQVSATFLGILDQARLPAQV